MHWLNMTTLKALRRGIISYTPHWNIRHQRTGGTDSARYCYSVWLRHLIMAFKKLPNIPKVIAELGPGDSIGIGLAGLISGAEKYYALDVVEFSNLKKNIEIFDELAALFKKRIDIPGEKEFPKVKPLLKSYKFPNHILGEEHLKNCLEPNRINCIRDSIINYHKDLHGNIIKYYVPWHDSRIIEKESVDFAYSQAVMEHVDLVKDTYSALYRWLKPYGIMSHTIDYESHGTAKDWNGHWAYPDVVWKLIRGKKPFLLNRLPHSKHIIEQKEQSFDIILEINTKNYSGINRQQLAPRFKTISDSDFTTSGAYILSAKK